jgi:flagellar motor protein MotB
LEAGPITSLNRLVAGFVLARATDIARGGDYEAARAALSTLTREPCADAGALNLLASICAQEGRLAEAKQYWERALLLAPNSERYKSALKRIATLEANPVWFRLVRPLTIAVILILFFSSLYYLSRVSQRRDSNQPTATSVVGPQAAEYTSNQKQPLERDLEVEGVLAEEVPEGTLLRFESGLFSTAARLTPSGKLVLARLARVIEQHNRPLDIKIIGHCDALPIKPTSRFHDAADLEIARAVSVFEELRTSTKIHSDAFSISAEDSRRPIPTTPGVAHKENRTVTIVLSERVQ